MCKLCIDYMNTNQNRNILSQSNNIIKHFFISRYRLYVWRYIAYARMRGFKSFNDWKYHRRGFIECWAAPGFHRFWEIWNPGIAYFVFRLYLKLGGHNNRMMATFFAFIINGIVHTVVFFVISGKYSYTIVILFSLFAILTLLNKKVESILSQKKWPWFLNSGVNILLVIGSFDLSFKINTLLNRI